MSSSDDVRDECQSFVFYNDRSEPQSVTIHDERGKKSGLEVEPGAFTVDLYLRSDQVPMLKFNHKGSIIITVIDEEAAERDDGRSFRTFEEKAS